MKKEYRIAIIGCGVSGIAALTQLLDDETITREYPEIIIFDKNPVEDSNIYLNATDDLFLNTSASLNSLLVDDPDHFYNWVLENRDKWQNQYPDIINVEPETFLPRNIFLLYMKDLFSNYLEKAKQLGVHIEVVRNYVNNIIPKGNNTFILETENGNSFMVQQVIAAIGDGNCKNKYGHLQGIPHYLDRPCMPIAYYKKLFDSQSILVIGSMLSAVDALLLLQKHKAKITLASSTGTFPSVRSTYLDNLKNYQELLNISDINTLLQKMLEKLPTAIPQERDAADLNYDLRNDGWCHYVAPFLNRVNDLWSEAPEEERKKFKESYQFNRTKRYMSAIPPIVADKLASKFSNGDIVIKKGLENVTYQTQTKKFIAVYANKDQEYFDACINASAATNNARTNLDLKKFHNVDNIHIIGDSNARNFINNGIFLFVREVQRIMPNIRRQVTLFDSRTASKPFINFEQQLPKAVGINV